MSSVLIGQVILLSLENLIIFIDFCYVTKSFYTAYSIFGIKQVSGNVYVLFRHVCLWMESH